MKFSGCVYRFVKLHRPPPDIRIFSPMLAFRSSTMTERPRLPASTAHRRPAAPAPMMTTSAFIWSCSWNFAAGTTYLRFLASYTDSEYRKENTHARNARNRLSDYWRRYAVRRSGTGSRRSDRRRSWRDDVHGRWH